MNKNRDIFFVCASILVIFNFLSFSVFAADQYTIVDLGATGESWSANSINNAGQIAGRKTVGGGYYHAVLWEDGVLTDLGTLGGRLTSYADDINDSSQVVGIAYYGYGGSYSPRAFLWKNGIMGDLGSYYDPFSDAEAEAFDINNSGQVVGDSYRPDWYYKATLWENGTTESLGSLWEGGHSKAYGINDSTQIVGWANANSNSYHAFLWENGTMSDLGTLGGKNSIARDINNSGQAIGSSQFIQGSNYERGFLWENGTMSDLGTLGGIQTFPIDINGSGKIVGFSSISGGWDFRAFIWENGVIKDLNDFLPVDSGWVLTSANDINDSGWIVGSGLLNGQGRPFLMKIVPEPASIFLMVTGSLAFSVARLKIRKKCYSGRWVWRRKKSAG